MRLCKALLIDSTAREVREIEYAANSEIEDPRSLQTLLGGYIQSAWMWDSGDVCFVDEEGLLKPQKDCFVLLPLGDGVPLAGNGIVVGPEIEDEGGGWHTAPPTLTANSLRRLVRFLDRAQAGRTPHPIGYGATAEAAVADLLRLLDEEAERAAIKAGHPSPYREEDAP